MARIGDKLTAANMIMVVVIAIVGVYLWGTFTQDAGIKNCTQQDVTDKKYNCEVNADTDKNKVLDSLPVANGGLGTAPIPREGTLFKAPKQPELEGSTLWIIKLLVIGGAIWIGYGVVSKFIGRNMSRRDILSLVLLGVAVYFIWNLFIAPSNLLEATRFTCEATDTACRGLTLDQIGKFTAMKLGLA